MVWQRIWGIMRKDLLAVWQSRILMVSLVMVFATFYLLLPLVLGVLFRFVQVSSSDVEELGSFLTQLPTGLRAQLEQLDPGQQLAILFLGYLLAPLTLMAPLATTVTIAADGLAGERERRTLEAILVTPIREEELFLSKVLAPLLPAVTVGWLGGIGYALVSVATVGVGPPLLPSWPWLILTIFGGPAISSLALGVTVLVASRVQGMREVQQLVVLVIFPVFGLSIAQGTGLFFLDWKLALLGCGLLWMVAVLLIRGVRRFFERESLLRLN